MDESGEPKLDIMMCHTLFATHNRFIVPENSCIGLGPVRAREGDIVCVLFGRSVPVLLREEGDKITFVGEAYVHGFMDGEVITVMKAGKTEKKEGEFLK